MPGDNPTQVTKQLGRDLVFSPGPWTTLGTGPGVLYPEIQAESSVMTKGWRRLSYKKTWKQNPHGKPTWLRDEQRLRSKGLGLDPPTLPPPTKPSPPTGGEGRAERWQESTWGNQRQSGTNPQEGEPSSFPVCWTRKHQILSTKLRVTEVTKG